MLSSGKRVDLIMPFTWLHNNCRCPYCISYNSGICRFGPAPATCVICGRCPTVLCGGGPTATFYTSDIVKCPSWASPGCALTRRYFECMHAYQSMEKVEKVTQCSSESWFIAKGSDPLCIKFFIKYIIFLAPFGETLCAFCFFPQWLYNFLHRTPSWLWRG